MTLAAGTRIGLYEILGAIGAGGMGEVYRARDLRLNREVAIKVLPAFFAGDSERLARFAREAQVLASLNHPNIAHVHGFEEGAPLGEKGVGAAGALVMELVDGPTLAERIAQGPIPLDEALPIARQIVAALEAAHAQGIVHRDLKPANIKVRDDGTVKVLDFGLAKLAAPDPAGSEASLANSPTLTAHSTQLGMVIGTAAYMSPEQAKGKAVDKRTDIWAFGAVLFEMLSGRQLFGGDTVSEVLANVLKDEPKWSDLPPNTPPALRRLLARCLERDPKRRLHDVADALPDLDEAAAGGSSIAAASTRHSFVYGVAGLLVGAAIAALAFVVWGSAGRRTPDATLRTLSVLPPPGQQVVRDTSNGAISPNGRIIVFKAGSAADGAQLFLRRLDTPMPRALAGTKDASEPFWSPDNARIGFFADGKLKTIRIGSGAVTEICDAPDPRGGTWNATGEIVFQPSSGGPLMEVSAEGGDPKPATKLDASRGEIGHRFPVVLPDGRHFLYVALPGREGHLDIVAGSLDDLDEHQVVAAADSGVVFADGHLIFARSNGIAAQPFDPGSLSLSGNPITLSDLAHDVQSQYAGAPVVSVSTTGTLLSYAGAVTKTRFVWYDMKGNQLGGFSAPEGNYVQVSISPDGKQAAAVRVDSPVRSDIWILDLQRGGATPLTSGPGRNEGPQWSPDGKRIAFDSDRNNQSQIYVKTADGSGVDTQVTSDAEPFKSPGGWSKDGKLIVYSALDPKTQRDLWTVSVDGDRTPKPFLRSQFNEVNPTISPDGRWLSYMSDETGQMELYVQSFPGGGNKYRVSDGGVDFGGWFPDGRIVYGKQGHDAPLYSVSVTEGPPFRTGPPQKMAPLPEGFISLDLMPDRSKQLAIVPAGGDSLVTLTVVQNWTQMLRAR
ncbi:MAG TPA: protein kinase [Vicinamibacterales bacterium]